MQKSARQASKQHNSSFKNYKSTEKINGTIPFRLKKYIRSSKNVSRSSNKISSKGINSLELSNSVSDTTKTLPMEINISQLPNADPALPSHSGFISRTEIQLKPCSIVPEKKDSLISKTEIQPKPCSVVPEKKDFLISKTEIQLKPCSVVLRRYIIQPKHEENEEVSQLDSILCSLSSRTMHSQTPSKLNIKSRRNYGQPKTLSRETNYLTVVKKEEIEVIHRKPPALLKDELAQKRSNRNTSIVSLGSKKRKKNPIKQKSKCCKRKQKAPKNSTSSKRRKNNYGASSIDDISLKCSLPSMKAHLDITSSRRKSKCRRSTREKTTPVVEKTKKSRKPRLKKQIVSNQAQSKKRTSKRDKKISSSKRKKSKVQFSVEKIPIDDLALPPSTLRAPKRRFRFTRKSLKRKRIAIDALLKADEQYEDDMNDKKLDHLNQLPTSYSPTPSGTSTPKCQFPVTPPKSQEPPKFVDCINPPHFRFLRKVAEELMLIKEGNQTADMLSTCSISSF